MNKDSLLFWYPLIQDLLIPQPKTSMRTLSEREKSQFGNWIEGQPSKEITHVLRDLRAIIQKYGYPVFIRTDLASGKHSYKDSCFIPSEDKLKHNLAEVIEFNYCADIMGLPFEAIIVREFIELEAPFKAFWGNLPIAKERRLFIKEGKIDGYYPYWPEDAIKPDDEGFLPDNWKEQLESLNKIDSRERKTLTKYAMLVAELLEGYWLVDFAKSKNGEWILIDMATGERSWRPETLGVD